MYLRLHRLLLCLIVALAFVSISGCASTGSSNEKRLLAASGFDQRKPETPQQKELYDATPAYSVQRVTFNGRIFYVYKDEKSGTAWVGDELNYQKYEHLAGQQQITQHQNQAVEMQRNLAMGWYGAYGTRVGGIRPRPRIR